MTKNEMANKMFEATAKLELMQTLLGVLIESTDGENANIDEALTFAYQKEKLHDLLHIALDGIVDVKKMVQEVAA